MQLSTNGSTWLASLSLTPSSGSINQTIYARISASAPAGSVSGSISHSGGGASTVYVSVSGTVSGTGGAPTATNLGTISDTSATYTVADLSRIDAYAAGQVRWYTFTTATNVTNAAGLFLDLDTDGTFSGGDTEIAIYTSTGNLIVEDDDDGPVTYSALSFGQTSPLRGPIGSANAGDGRDGSLNAGTYYLAVAGYNAAFGATGWSVTTGSGGNITIYFRT